MTSKHRTDQVKVTLTYHVIRTRIYRENYSKGLTVLYFLPQSLFLQPRTLANMSPICRQYVANMVLAKQKKML